MVSKPIEFEPTGPYWSWPLWKRAGSSLLAMTYGPIRGLVGALRYHFLHKWPVRPNGSWVKDGQRYYRMDFTTAYHTLTSYYKSTVKPAWYSYKGLDNKEYRYWEYVMKPGRVCWYQHVASHTTNPTTGAEELNTSSDNTLPIMTLAGLGGMAVGIIFGSIAFFIYR